MNPDTIRQHAESEARRIAYCLRQLQDLQVAWMLLTS